MSERKKLSRDDIIGAIAGALESLDYVHAMWECGAVANDRADEWSDIDICVDAEDERVKEAFPVVERALEALAPIELKYDVLAPTLGEYVQAFYRLQGAGKFMLVDFAVFKHSAADKLLEPEIHGNVIFHFNKKGAVKVPALDPEKHLAAIKTALELSRKKCEMFAPFVEKEMLRGDHLRALGLYQRMVLAALVEALRIKHKPEHYDFGLGYTRYHLPEDIVRRLKDLYFVSGDDDLAEKYKRALAWYDRIFREVDFEEVERKLRRTHKIKGDRNR
jgi:predicted nucleotidyltransferase